MELQEWITRYDFMATVIAFDVFQDGSYSEMRIAASNPAYTEYLSVTYPEAPAFYPGVPLRRYFTEINLENFVIKATTTHDPLYSYVNAHGSWIKGFYLPILEQEKFNVSPSKGVKQTLHCLLLISTSDEIESDSIAQCSPAVSSAVMQISIKLNQTQDYVQAMCTATIEVQKICGSEHCALLTVDRSKQLCRLFGEAGECPDILHGFTSAMGRTPYETFLAWERDLNGSDCLLLDDLHVLEDRDPIWCQSLRENGIYNIVLYAIREHQNLVGFIWAANYDTAQSMHIKETLELTAFLLAATITKQQLLEQLEYLSSVDALTNVRNRNSMNVRVDKLVSGEEVLPETMGVVLADLNGLKTVNDDEGHDAGDKLLIRAATLLNFTFEDYEIYRAGGDEFFVFCPEITADKLTEKVKQLYSLANSTTDVSFACGSVFLTGEYDIRNAMKVADERMYKAKKEYYRLHPEKDRRKRSGRDQ